MRRRQPSRLILYEAKEVSANVFVGSQIKTILECKEFLKKLTRQKKAAWGFLVHHKTENYLKLVEKLVKNYDVSSKSTTSLMVILMNSRTRDRRRRRPLPQGFTGLTGVRIYIYISSRIYRSAVIKYSITIT